MEFIPEQLAGLLGVEIEIIRRLLNSLLVVAILWLIRLIVLRLVYRNVDDPHQHYYWQKHLTYIFSFLGVLILGSIWIEQFESIVTFIGLLSAGIAIALKDLVADLAAWIYLLWRKPFEIGDRIEIDDEIKGDVADKRLFKFTLVEIGNWVDADQSTGRVIHIPNHYIFTRKIANYTSDFEFIWNEVQVMVTFESHWKKAKKILQEIADRHSASLTNEARRQLRQTAKTYLVVYNILTPTVYTSVKEYGVALTIRYLTNPRNRRGTEQVIWEEILSQFGQEDDIQYAYPTYRFFSHPKEGKPGTRPDWLRNE